MTIDDTSNKIYTTHQVKYLSETNTIVHGSRRICMMLRDPVGCCPSRPGPKATPIGGTCTCLPIIGTAVPPAHDGDAPARSALTYLLGCPPASRRAWPADRLVASPDARPGGWCASLSYGACLSGGDGRVHGRSTDARASRPGRRETAGRGQHFDGV